MDMSAFELARKTFPRAMYHKDHNEPIIVSNKVDMEALESKGWIDSYMYKEYPKMVEGVVVNSKEEEAARLSEAKGELKMKVVKESVVESNNPDIAEKVAKETGAKETTNRNAFGKFAGKKK